MLEAEERLAGAGAQPNFLVSDTLEVAIAEATDKAQISGPPLNSTQANAALQSKTVQEAVEEQYIENSSEYHDLVNGGKTKEAPPPPPPPNPSPSDPADGASGTNGTNGTSPADSGDETSGMGGAIDTADNLDGDLTDKVLEFTEEDYMVQNEDGYWEPDPEKLEEWTKYIITRANILAALLIAIGNQFETKKLVEEAFTGEPIQDDKYSYKETFARKIRILQKMSQVAVAKLFEKINTDNLKIYNDKMAKIKNKYNKWYDKVGNFFTGGKNDMKKTRMALKESEKYYKTTQKTLAAMQGVINSVIALITQCFASGDMNMMALGMVKSLKAFSAKIDEMNAEVDKGLAEVQKNLDKIEKDNPKGFRKNFKKFWKSLGKFDWKGIWSSISGMNNAVCKAMEKTGVLWGLAQIFKIGSVAADFMAALPRIALDLMKKIGRLMQEVGDVVVWWICQWNNDSREWYAKTGRKYSIGYWAGRGLEELSKGTEKGVNKLNELLEKTGKWQYVLGPVLSFIPVVGMAYGFVKWADSSEYDFAEGAEYMTLDIEGMLADYRGGLVASQNGIRSYLSIKMLGRDMRNIAREKFTGLSGIKNDAEMLMQSAESALGHATQVFDATASQLMLKSKLHNTNVQLLKNYQQLLRARPFRLAAVVLTIAAVAVSIYSLGATAPAMAMLVAAVCGLAGGLMNAIGTYEASRIKEYNPIEAHYNEPITEKKGHGDAILDVLDEIEMEQKATVRAAAYNNGMLGQTGDDFYFLNTKQFAAYEMKLKMMDNAVRSIFSLIKNSRDLRRVADSEFTGSSSANSGEALLQNAVENIMMQRQTLLSAIKFHHQEVVIAKNMKLQADIGAKDAMRGAAISVAGAALGAVLGYIISPALWGVYMGIVSALSSAAFQLYTAVRDHNKIKGAFNVVSEDLDNILRSRGAKSVEAKLDAIELKAYQELMEHGIVSSGDGYYGVNFSLVTSVYSRIGRIYAAKEALAKARALSSELRMIVKQEFTGQTLSTQGELSKSTNQASFSTAMKVVSNIVRALQEKVKVMNRARDKEKAMKMAAATFGVNAVFAIVGGVGGAATLNSTTSGLITFHKACMGLTSGLMSLTNSLASLITASITLGKNDYGSLKGYEAKTTVDKTGRRVNNEAGIDSRMDKMEYEIMLEMNSSLMTSIDSTFMMVSPEASKLSGRMKALYNVREAIAVARSILTDAKSQAKARFSGKSMPRKDFGKDSLNDHKSVALSMLDSLKGALDSIIERRNQIKGAISGVILSSIRTAVSLATIGLSAYNARMKAEHKILTKGKSFWVKDKRSFFKGKNMTTIGKDIGKFNRVIAALNLASRLIDITVDLTYDGVHNKNAKKADAPKERSAQKSSDYFNSMDNMDADIEAAQVALSFIDQENMKASYVAARSEKTSNFIMSEAKNSADTYLRLRKTPEKTNISAFNRKVQSMANNPKNSARDVAWYIVKQPNKALIKSGIDQLGGGKVAKERALKILKQVEMLDPKLAPMVAQAAAALNAPAANKVSTPTNVNRVNQSSRTTTHTRTQALLKQANQIANHISSSKVKTVAVKKYVPQRRLAAPKASSLQLKAQLVQLKQKRDAVQKQLSVKIKELNALKTQLPKIRAEVAAWQKQADVQIGQLRRERTEIGKKIFALQTKKKLTAQDKVLLAKLKVQLKSVESQEKLLIHAKQKITDRIKLAEQKIKGVETEVKGLRANLQGLQKDITSLERDIKKAEVREASRKAGAQASQEAPGSSILAFIQKFVRAGRERVQKDMENVVREVEQPKPGLVDRAPSVLAGIARSQVKKSYRQQYEDALREENSIKTSGAGVA